MKELNVTPKTGLMVKRSDSKVLRPWVHCYLDNKHQQSIESQDIVGSMTVVPSIIITRGTETRGCIAHLSMLLAWNKARPQLGVYIWNRRW